MPANLENSAAATGLEKVSFHSNPKERQCQRMLKLPHNCTHLTLLITSWTYNVLLRPVQNFSCEIFLSPLPRVNPSFCVLPLHLTVFCNCFPILNTPYNKYFFILVHDLKNLNILESFFLGIFRKKKKLRDENEKRDSINSQEEQMLLQHCLFFFFKDLFVYGMWAQ